MWYTVYVVERARLQTKIESKTVLDKAHKMCYTVYVIARRDYKAYSLQKEENDMAERQLPHAEEKYNTVERLVHESLDFALAPLPDYMQEALDRYAEEIQQALPWSDYIHGVREVMACDLQKCILNWILQQIKAQCLGMIRYRHS